MVLNPLQPWLSDHPALAWFIAHPLWIFGILALGLIVLVGLGSTLARLTEALGVQLVKLPITLANGMMNAVTYVLLQRRITRSTPAPEHRLEVILERLETLHREQDALLAELRQLLAQRPNFPHQP